MFYIIILLLFLVDIYIAFDLNIIYLFILYKDILTIFSGNIINWDSYPSFLLDASGEGSNEEFKLKRTRESVDWDFADSNKEEEEEEIGLIERYKKWWESLDWQERFWIQAAGAVVLWALTEIGWEELMKYLRKSRGKKKELMRRISLYMYMLK